MINSVGQYKLSSRTGHSCRHISRTAQQKKKKKRKKEGKHDFIFHKTITVHHFLQVSGSGLK